MTKNHQVASFHKTWAPPLPHHLQTASDFFETGLFSQLLLTVVRKQWREASKKRMDINKDSTSRMLPEGICNLTLTVTLKGKQNFLYVWDKRLKSHSDHKDRKEFEFEAGPCQLQSPRSFFCIRQESGLLFIFLHSECICQGKRHLQLSSG